MFSIKKGQLIAYVCIRIREVYFKEEQDMSSVT